MTALKRRPWFYLVTFGVSMIVYLVALQLTGLISVQDLFTFTRSGIDLTVGRTEVYGDATLKRLVVQNGDESLRAIHITVRAPSAMEEIRAIANPSIPCRSQRFESPDGTALFDVSCDRFAARQQLELVIFRIGGGPSQVQGTVAVEIVATDMRGRRIGTSATGTFDLEDGNL